MNINSFSPIPEDDNELHLPELVYWASLGDVEQVEQGLQEGLNVNSADEEGYSALQAAAENDHLAVVKLLVSKGADLAHRSPHTALELAEMARNKEVIAYLKSLTGGI
ncbi:ankyrin repeat domain-containing protein [Acinetobacter bohemicus]|nr:MULTISPECIES: ankyrin repeat domain-containing protein [unclassified Acinetobacter]MCO8045208.1 ankyrin repeat domain-containing protein [Acinetobacter sp. S4397-1]TSH75798.1 ankyrin repeat domain-containing protein [Acinetobacter sp. RF15A]TSI17437.1 ankyrin repeat domain-containing protein [Acinetobacter sp. RF15B]